MVKRSNEHKALHRSANYYEPLFRAKVVRAMKRLRKETSVEDIASLLRSHQPIVIDRKRIRELLKPAAKVVRDAMVQGGKLGEERIKKLG